MSIYFINAKTNPNSPYLTFYIRQSRKLQTRTGHGKPSMLRMQIFRTNYAMCVPEGRLLRGIVRYLWQRSHMAGFSSIYRFYTGQVRGFWRFFNNILVSLEAWCWKDIHLDDMCSATTVQAIMFCIWCVFIKTRLLLLTVGSF